MTEIVVESAENFAGDPDGLERLWTPHRMAYIGGENKPHDASQRECPFCTAPARGDADALIVWRGNSAFVLLNLYPYNTGHLLVCPYRHVADYTELTEEERTEIGLLSARAMTVVRHVMNAEGFNLGMNQGAVAGAGIAAHLHQHVIPRWTGDSNFFPLIAKTKALPEILSDTRSRLAAAWPESDTDAR